MSIKRRFLSIVVIFLMMSGCGIQKQKKLQFLVTPKSTNTFWLQVKAGADSAGQELGVDIIWNGPATETGIAEQIAIVENYINKRIDAIVIAGCDTRALVPVIEKADAAGIPVVTIDSGIDSDIPKSFVATDNILGAKKAAQSLSELIGKKGKVACIPFVPGAATSMLREQGFKEGLKDYPNVKLVAVQYCQSDAALAMSVTENILTAHPDLAGIFAANDQGAIGCAQALVARNLKGKVKLVGFDADPHELHALKSGLIQSLIVQDPFKMGYLGVKTVYEVIQGKTVEKRIDTGVSVITLDNLNTPEIKKLINPSGTEFTE